MELLSLGALVWKVIDFLKYLSNKKWPAVTTQVMVWVGGIIAVFLYGATQFAGDLKVSGISLSDFAGWDKVLLGLSVGSLISVAYDGKKMLDHSDSAAVPELKVGSDEQPSG